MSGSKGITGADGELWREQRAFLMSHFRALGYGKGTMEEMVHEEVTDLLDTIRANPVVVDVSAMLAPMVLSILWKLTSGRYFYYLNIPNCIKLALSFNI